MSSSNARDDGLIIADQLSGCCPTFGIDFRRRRLDGRARGVYILYRDEIARLQRAKVKVANPAHVCSVRFRVLSLRAVSACVYDVRTKVFAFIGSFCRKCT